MVGCWGHCFIKSRADLAPPPLLVKFFKFSCRNRDEMYTSHGGKPVRRRTGEGPGVVELSELLHAIQMAHMPRCRIYGTRPCLSLFLSLVLLFSASAGSIAYCTNGDQRERTCGPWLFWLLGSRLCSFPLSFEGARTEYKSGPYFFPN